MFKPAKLCHRICLKSILVLLLFFSLTPLTFAGSDKKQHHKPQPLSLGFFPIVSTVALFKRFAPLSDYLSATLNRPVLLKTAKDFPTFVKRTDKRNYDIVVTAPHFAVRAADSGKYNVHVTAINDVQQLIVVHKNSSIKDIQELAGRVIATPPKRALMTMMGMQYLHDKGLIDAKMPVYRHFVSHNAANEAVLAGEVDAAIASSNIIHKAIKKEAPLKIIEHGFSLPNMATLVASDMDEQLAIRITTILVNMKQTEVGRQVLNKIAFPGYRRVSAADYEPARVYMQKIQKHAE